MTPDPLAGSLLAPQSLNRYPYVQNDPVNLIDPLGLLHGCIPIGNGVFCLEDPVFVFANAGGGGAGRGDSQAPEIPLVFRPGGLPRPSGNLCRSIQDSIARQVCEKARQERCAAELGQILIETNVLPLKRIQAGLGGVRDVSVNPNTNKITLMYSLTNIVPGDEIPSRAGGAPSIESNTRNVSFNLAERTTDVPADIDPHNPLVNPAAHLRDVMIDEAGGALGKLEDPCSLLEKAKGNQ